MKKIHELWYFGRQDKNIRPYKDIDAEHFHGDRKQVMKRRSQAAGSIKYIDKVINNIDSKFLTLPVSKRDGIWKAAMVKLEEDMQALICERKRKVNFDDMMYTSLYENYITKVTKKPKVT